jgi:hypothetical protein
MWFGKNVLFLLCLVANVCAVGEEYAFCCGWCRVLPCSWLSCVVGFIHGYLPCLSELVAAFVHFSDT